MVGKVEEEGDQRDRNWADPGGGWVGFVPASVLPTQPEVDAGARRVGREPGVPSPHPQERLPNRTEGVRHRASSHGLLAGGAGPVPVELSEGLEVGDRIVVVKVGVDMEVGTEGEPSFPVGILGACCAAGDSTGDGLLNSDKCSCEYIASGRWHSRQDLVWG